MNLKNFALLSAMVIVVNACSPAPETPPLYGVSDLESQRVSGAEIVAVPGGQSFDQVSARVTLDVDGRVVDARWTDGGYPRTKPGSRITDAALAAVRQWRFRPQSFEGKPIRAVGEVTILLRPAEIPANPAVPFPTAPPEDIEISLIRTACFGICPDYKLTVTGDGRVTYESGENLLPGTAAEVHRQFNGLNVLLAGRYEARVSPAAVADLLARFRAARFFGLKPQYSASITDIPTYVLELRVGTRRMRVVDYAGGAVGMPAVVTELEDAVDQLAGSDRWVFGNRETLAALKARGFAVRSPAAAALVVALLSLDFWLPAQGDSDGLLRALIAEGLDLDAAVPMPPEGGRPRPPTTVGAVIASHAARIGNATLFEQMARQGHLAHLGQGELNELFQTGMGCSPAIARALVTAGANPKSMGERGNALHAIGGAYGACHERPEQQRAKMAAALITLGVPVDARNEDGETPLMGCNDPAMAKLLVAAGANPNAKAGDGTPVLLSLSDDRAIVTLLRAGANPNVRDRYGTLRQQSPASNRPATRAWLDAHGID
ncbi:hypothetical protein CAP39_03615 [Sphingomonas sp. IBVSS1]|nr:hypothetical protein CAP39_03615 [Sphingomonas sp. IBVSS1]